VNDALWVQRAPPRTEARRRLFCFPHAGAAASAYREWPNGLPSDIEVCAVQLPGREARMREAPIARMDEMVAALADGLRGLLDRPFAFFGHSMGAFIGFELARELRRSGAPGPDHLIMSAARAAHLPSSRRPLYALPEAEFVAEVRGMNGTPPEVLAHPELRRLVLPILRADCALCETWRFRAEAPLACDITVLGGIRDREVDRGQLEAWRELTTGACTVRMLPGDHFFIRSARLKVLALVAASLGGVSSGRLAEPLLSPGR
jgi:medium-chain acyl-[acyl-carrier-protein] hydrolase